MTKWKTSPRVKRSETEGSHVIFYCDTSIPRYPSL